MSGLTRPQEFCLRRLSEVDVLSSREIARMAVASGDNRRRYPNEWADAPLLFLRKKGLVSGGDRLFGNGRNHKITAAGRAALAKMGE